MGYLRQKRRAHTDNGQERKNNLRRQRYEESITVHRVQQIENHRPDEGDGQEIDDGADCPYDWPANYRRRQ